MEIRDEIQDFIKNDDTAYEVISILYGDGPLAVTTAHMAFCDRADRNVRAYLGGDNNSMFALLGELNALIFYHPPMAQMLVDFVFEKLEKRIVTLELFELMNGMYGLREAREIVQQHIDLSIGLRPVEQETTTIPSLNNP